MPEDENGPLSLADAVAMLGNTAEPDEGQPVDETETDDGAEPEAEADDEAESTEEEQPDDEPLEPEEEPSEPDEPEADKTAAANSRVRLPDGTFTTVDELIRGNMRDRDYRQKTMAHAEEVKTFKAQAEASNTRIAEERDYMSRLLQSIVPPAPELAMLETDPIGYERQRAMREQWLQHLTYLQQQQQRSKQDGQAQSAKAEQEAAATEFAKLVERMPELKSADKLKGFAADIKRHGAAYGFNDQELARIGLDHRQAMVIADAIKWRNLQAAKAKVQPKVEGKPPVQRAAARQSPANQRARQSRAAMDRLNSSGKLRDGVAALLASEKG